MTYDTLGEPTMYAAVAFMARFGLADPCAFKAARSNPDTLSWKQAMAIPEERAEWEAAALKEILSLVKRRTWVQVPISDARGRVIPGMWVFRRKRYPDGTEKSKKDRFTVRGDMQDEESDTFAPVCTWATVRMIMIMALTLDWDTCSIDFSNAFIFPSGFIYPKGFDWKCLVRLAFGWKNRCMVYAALLVLGQTFSPQLWSMSWVSHSR